jgi:hypothetical protein
MLKNQWIKIILYAMAFFDCIWRRARSSRANTFQRKISISAQYSLQHSSGGCGECPKQRGNSGNRNAREARLWRRNESHRLEIALRAVYPPRPANANCDKPWQEKFSEGFFAQRDKLHRRSDANRLARQHKARPRAGVWYDEAEFDLFELAISMEYSY